MLPDLVGAHFLSLMCAPPEPEAEAAQTKALEAFPSGALWLRRLGNRYRHLTGGSVNHRADASDAPALGTMSTQGRGSARGSWPMAHSRLFLQRFRFLVPSHYRRLTHIHKVLHHDVQLFEEGAKEGNGFLQHQVVMNPFPLVPPKAWLLRSAPPTPDSRLLCRSP